MRRRPIDPIDLEVCDQDGRYSLWLADRQLRTSIGGHPVQHEAPALIEHMINEFLKYPELSVVKDRIEEPTFFGAYNLFGLQKEFIEPRLDNLTENFKFELILDPVLTRLAGPEHLDQAARYGAVRRWLESENQELVDLDFVDLDSVEGVPDTYLRLSGTVGDSDTASFHRLAGFLHSVFATMEPEEKSAVVFLHNAHEGSLIHALALMSRACSVQEYAAGVGAAHGILTRFSDVSGEDHSGAFTDLKDAASAALEYVSAYRRGTPFGKLREILESRSEATDTEFKSTLRFDLKVGEKSRDITDAVVKTVAAFLNTRGGTLLIGVADDKEIVGLDHDGFSSDDEFLRHLYTVVSNALGTRAAPLMKAEIIDTVRGKVCMVDCERTPVPLVCNLRKTTDAFFVRKGPATVNLVGEDRDEFQQLHWSGGASPGR